MQDKPFDISRFEIKCFIKENMVDQVREMAHPYVKVDPFAEGRQYSQYTVKSLYFDTEALDFYFEKIDGLKIRKKLRIRTYNEGLENNTGFLEIKRRYVNNILKERYKMPVQQIEDFIESPEKQSIDYNDSTNGNAALSKFIYNLEKQKLVPKILIVYEREPYIAINNESIRLTMDFNIRAKINAHICDLYSKSTLKPVYQDKCILEFKYDDFMPLWMRKILSELKVSPQPISKYCSGIDSHLNPTKAK
jgi:SPX domain protein involved in polyphosphate accumulation